MAPSTITTVVLAVMARPSLWLVALRQASRLAPARWWSRPPFLPLPPGEYLHFRMVTAYGGDGSAASAQVAADVISYLKWCRDWRGSLSVSGRFPARR